MPQSLEVYAFLDRKQDGVFPVFDIDGVVFASIHTSFWNRDFRVTDASGAPMCSGSPAFMSRTYTVVDAAGTALFEMRSSFWNGKRRAVLLADGGELVLQGASWPSRDWSVANAAGDTVLGIVQVNRMLVKQARSSAG